MQKFSVTPIGTCRVHIPLKQALSKYPIFLNVEGVYGYTHTSAEALQQLRYLQGEKSFPAEVRPLVFRNDETTSEATGNWRPSDLHVVEISSSRKIRVRDDSVQLNYIYRYFSDFFASDRRTQRFWSLVKAGQRADLGQFLRAEPAYRFMSAEDRSLLTSLRMEEQDFASVKADMAEIADRLGRDAVVFMTHVDARTPDGATIPRRERLINWVKLAAAQLGVPCFDPTPLMEAFGPERALENGGLDLTHFTQAFCDRVYGELHRLHVAPRMELKPELIGWEDDAARHHLIADNVEALIRHGEFMSGVRRLHAELRKEPAAGPLLQLRGTVLAQLGDFDGAVRDLQPLDRSSVLSLDGRMALLEAYTATEDWAQALELAEALLGDEHENGAIYIAAAEASEGLGRPELALGYWKRAFRGDRSNSHPALRALTLLSQLGETEHFRIWREEVLEHGGSGLTGASDIAGWALEHRDEELFAKVFGVILELDAPFGETLLDGLFSAGMFGAAADCLEQLGRTTARGSDSARRIAIHAGEIAAKLFDQGAFTPAYRLAAAAARIRPGGAAARAQRASLLHFRQALRDAHSRQDYPAVAAIGQEAGDVILAAPDAALLVALSLHKLGQDSSALDLLLKMREGDSHNPAVLRWAGRIAAGLGRYEVALPAYSALHRSPLPAAAKFREEAGRFLETADRRALRQLRAVVESGEFGAALQLAELLRPEVRDQAGLAGEVERLNRRLRTRLRENEKEGGDEEDRAEILSLLLRLSPDDAAILRRSALEAMRKMRFAEAAKLWSRLNEVVPGVESSARNLERCRVLAARAEKASSVRLEPVG